MLEKRVANTTGAAQDYMDWHRTLDRNLYATDIDCVELSETFQPLAFVELKSVSHVDLSGMYSYLRSLSDVYVGPGKVGTLFKHVHDRTGALPLIVAYDFRNLEAKKFYVFNMREENPYWRRYFEPEFVIFLREMRGQ